MSSSTGVHFKSGQVVATSANIDIRSLGFRPTKIVVQNLTNDVKVEWHAGIAEGANVKTVQAGTRSLVTTGGMAPLDADAAGNPGLRITALADVNDTTTEALAWQAWGGSPAQAA